MTHSKIQKMKFFVFLFIFVLAEIAICDGSFRAKRNNNNSVSLEKTGVDGTKTNNTQTSAQKNRNNKTEEKSKLNITSITPQNKNLSVTTESVLQQSDTGHIPTLNSGALLRGFYVFAGLSVLVMAYIVFRSFRLSKSRNQMIRKYGILAHRQDVEMRPLPLDEDDEDDTTVFDVRNISEHNNTEQQQIT